MKELDELRNLGIKNPYFLLQLKESATEAEINEAFKKLIKKYPENAKNKDNEYVTQMIKSSRVAILNQESRRIIDGYLQSERKAHALEPFKNDTASNNSNTTSKQKQTTEEVLASANPTIQKKARKECLLPEILEDYGLHNSGELSFADLQLILKEYLKKSWPFYQTEARGEAKQNLTNIYLLLDKKAQLYCVEDIFCRGSWLDYDSRHLQDIFTRQELYKTEGSTYKVSILDSAIKLWNDRLPQDECLVSMQTIFPYYLLENGAMSKGDIMKGIELGNECLFELRKTGYMKKTTAKEYIK